MSRNIPGLNYIIGIWSKLFGDKSTVSRFGFGFFAPENPCVSVTKAVSSRARPRPLEASTFGGDDGTAAQQTKHCRRFGLLSNLNAR